MLPMLVLMGGGDLPCPSPGQEHQASPSSTVAVFVQSSVPLLILALPPPLQPREGSRAAGRSPLLTVRIFSMNAQTTG